MAVGGQRHAPTYLPLEQTAGTHCIKKLDGPLYQNGRLLKTSSPSGFDPVWSSP